MSSLHRRKFLSSMIAFPMMAATIQNNQSKSQKHANANRLKTSLNAYSFNEPLLNDQMTVFGLLEYCADAGFDGVDITGYYLKGYPAVPDDNYLFEIKRRAFELGTGISGTGVRNDFTLPDKIKRSQEVDLVKRWVEVAAKIGAPVIRIFAGNQKNENITREKVTEWMIEDIHKCVEFGKQHGVIIGLQNHNDFIQTADQVISINKTINSKWLGIVLDTGSYRVNDPYEEIKKSINYTVNWQIKENVFINGKEIETDLDKLMSIIKSSNYNGYLPIETLGEGDPKIKTAALLAKLKKAMNT